MSGGPFVPASEPLPMPMKQILILEVSPRGASSASREVTKKLSARVRADFPKFMSFTTIWRMNDSRIWMTAP
jgi:hypothetical protein